MKIKTCIAALLLLCVYGRTQAQSVQPLKPGDTVPDAALKMVNYASSKARLSHFTNRLVILEFWSPLCMGCAHKVALLDSLQRQFKDTIYILPVSAVQTGDNARSIQQFIEGYKQRISNGFIMPSVVEDSVLAGLFPFVTVPDCIWIQKGVYTLRTDADALTPDNIRAVIKNEPVAITQKTDRRYYDRDVLLKAVTAGTPVQAVAEHLYKGEISALEPVSGFLRDTGGTSRIVALNSSVGALYALAYNAPVPLYKNRVVNKTGRDSLFAWGAEIPGVVYSYEFIAAANAEALRKQMQQDLCHYFKMEAGVEKQTMRCYVLQAKDTGLLRSSGKIAGNSLYETINGKRVLYNQPVSVLLERLNQLYSMPVFDETGIGYNIDLELPADLTDVAALKASLEQQGMHLTATERPVEVFVLSPPGNCTP